MNLLTFTPRALARPLAACAVLCGMGTAAMAETMVTLCMTDSRPTSAPSSPMVAA